MRNMIFYPTIIIFTVQFRYFYFYLCQILTAFDRLKIMLEFPHDNWKRLKIFTGFIKSYLLEDITTVRLNIYGHGSMFQSDIIGAKTVLCLVMSDNERQLLDVPWLSKLRFNLFFLVITTFSFAILNMKSRTFLRLSSRVATCHQY